jgi:hypothetical protein
VLIQVPLCTCCREHVRFAERLVGRDDQGALVAAGGELEEQVRCFGLERDVADLVE